MNLEVLIKEIEKMEAQDIELVMDAVFVQKESCFQIGKFAILRCGKGIGNSEIRLCGI